MPLHLSIAADALDDAQLAPALEALRAGKVIAYPTDTLYGLGADPRLASAVERIFRIKARSEGQPLPLVAADLAQAESVARVTPPASRLAARFWPGPLTLVLHATTRLAPGVAAPDATIAIRVPDHAVARALARGLGHPITATSANKSGAPPTSDATIVLTTLAEDIALIVDAGPAPGGPPSTIVDLTGDAPRLVRAGAVAWNRVLESLE